MIPVLTTAAGSCLTAKNWQEAGVSMGSLHLASLIFKPGLKFLYQLSSIKSYFGLKGAVVLNAAFTPDRKGTGYSFRSPYDGQKITLNLTEIMKLVARLKPEMALLPKDVDCHNEKIWNLLPSDTRPLFYSGNSAENHREYGLYFDVASADDLKSVEIEKAKASYVFGDIDISLVKKLIKLDVCYFESNKPADNACQGHLYTTDGMIDIKEKRFANEFSIIDKNCPCPSCKQQLTLAYFHHLLAQTPLLAQRFLIQHNIVQVIKLMGKK